MQIVLMATFENGNVGFPPERIEGIEAPRRFYAIEDGIVTLAGQPDQVLHHDAEQLLQQSIYRMPTPVEQEQMTQQAQQDSQVQEQVDNPDGTEPPAKQKKNSGG